ncbi:N amino acid transport system protein [Venturia nashicola]|uniref:N amino acid transport system protein n=1 Tax=Venturia nashicola TaxID=86259 RepID=A0A4Z1NMZ7_9PEZI|nr:N amino acid transport system protein [Venturia nashicola]TLD22487.1 N amino acid transport system protein [Venturia nashicola]
MEPITEDKGVFASSREHPLDRNSRTQMQDRDGTDTPDTDQTYQNDAEKDATTSMGPTSSTQEGELVDKNLVDYQTMNWFHGGMLMIAECISLGILGLPNAMAQLGLFPGVFLIIVLGVIAGYTGAVIGEFKIKFPHVHSMADAGRMIGGKPLEILFGLGQNIVLLFIAAAHINTFTIMMNVLTEHSTCSVVFSVVALVVCALCTIPRTLKAMSFLSCASCLSIVVAVVIVMVAVGNDKTIQSTPKVLPKTSFKEGMNAALNIVLAYAGHVTYFGFFSELKNPRDYKKSLILLQTTAITLYVLVAVVIYCYVGQDVKSPALSSAKPMIRKIAYGVAIPTIVIAGVLNAHVASTAVYRWAWKKRGHPMVYKERSLRAWVSWIVIVVTVWALAWLIAEAIPTFKYLLGLVSALFSGWYSFGITSVLYWFTYKGQLWSTKSGNRNWARKCLTLLNIIIFGIGAIICVAGLTATGMAFADGTSGKPFTCDDTSI